MVAVHLLHVTAAGVVTSSSMAFISLCSQRANKANVTTGNSEMTPMVWKEEIPPIQISQKN